MKVLMRERDLSDDYIQFACQIGADGFDIHDHRHVPGVVERGYADAKGTRKLLDRLRRRGLGVYRVAPPTPMKYLLGQPGGNAEIEDLGRTLEALGLAGVPFMSVPAILEDNYAYRGLTLRQRRGGYRMKGFDLGEMQRSLEVMPLGFTADPADVFERTIKMYERLVPIAEGYNIRLITHPSDPPLPDMELSPRRWTSIFDLVPSTHNGMLYCIGTRFETGVNIYDDITTWGRRGKIFHTHFRNVRGTIPSTGGYDEVQISDGDMNMFRVLKVLKSAGFDGGLQIDHVPTYDGDTPYQGMASAFAVGYVKALLAALEV